MKSVLALLALLTVTPALAVKWKYQVNVNGNKGAATTIDGGKNTFEAGPYNCEATPIHVSNNTEFRSLICAVGSGTVSTGGLCTQKKAKISSVQYAILNLNGPKNGVNIVLSCEF